MTIIKLKKLVKKAVVLIVVTITICLTHQLVIFILFNESPKLEISKVSDDLNYKNKKIKKTWRGNCLDIEAATDIYMCGQPTYARFKEDRIEIHEFYCHNFIRCWGYGTYSSDYTLCYNNIFSSLKAYLLDDIKISYIEHSHYYDNCDIGNGNDKEYMKSKGFIYLSYSFASYVSMDC